MIRRAANAFASVPVSGQPSPAATAGWVLAWLTRVDDLGNETLVCSFEEGQHGYVSEVPANQIQFQDGLPSTVPTIE